MSEEKNAGPKASFSDQARSGQGQLRSALSEASAGAKEAGQNVVSRAKHEAQSFFNGKRDAVTTAMSNFAEATRQVAQTMRDRDDATIARYTESVADQVEGLALYVESLEPGKVIRDIEATARRQPLLFYGGLFVAGLALSRFLRASDRSNHSSVGDQSDFQEMTSQIPSSSDRAAHAYAGGPAL
jgi:hypothetical protein